MNKNKKIEKVFTKVELKNLGEINDYLSDLNKKIVHKFNDIASNPAIKNFRKKMRNVIDDLSATKDIELVDGIESLIEGFVFTDIDGFTKVERRFIAQYYLCLFLTDTDENDNPFFVLPESKIFRYLTTLKVGEYQHDVEIFEFVYMNKNIVILDLDEIETVENIVKLTESTLGGGEVFGNESPDKIVLVW
ncbi:MAG: hypothetical protein IKA36_04160 [Clostridia bacterium]|nr:hypothetical protein [Clostridia bacterium]